MIEIFEWATVFTNDPAGDIAGAGWDRVNMYNHMWDFSRDYMQTMVHRLFAIHMTHMELAEHQGTIGQLSARAISTLSMTNYNATGLGPQISGLDGYNLSQDNPLNRQGQQFSNVQTPLMQHAANCFRLYLNSGNVRMPFTD